VVIFDPCTYEGAHDRCRKLWGRASEYLCIGIGCGEQAVDWAYDGGDCTQLGGPLAPADRLGGRSYYSRFPEFYMPLCRRCHKQLDAPQRTEPYARVPMSARLNAAEEQLAEARKIEQEEQEARVRMSARLAAAGEQLAEARKIEQEARAVVRALAKEASAAGFSEVDIAEVLDVDRGSVRAWIGKPRKERR
jgi:hypothetical protein